MIIVAATNEKSQISVIKSMSKGVISAGFRTLSSITNEMPHQNTPTQPTSHDNITRQNHTTKSQEHEGMTTTRYTPSTSYVAECTVLEPSLPYRMACANKRKHTCTPIHMYSIQERQSASLKRMIQKRLSLCNAGIGSY